MAKSKFTKKHYSDAVYMQKKGYVWETRTWYKGMVGTQREGWFKDQKMAVIR